MLNQFVNLPRLARRLLLLTTDTIAIVISVWAAFALRLGDWWPDMLENVVWLFPLAVVVSIPVFYAYGLYRSVVRYAGGEVLYSIVQAVSISLLLMIAAWVFVRGGTVPRSAWFNYWFVLIALVGGSRLLLRDLLRGRFSGASNRGERVAIYGAGAAGIQLATALQHSPEFTPVALVDDKRDLQGSEILGLKVYPPSKLPSLIQRKQISSVLLAIPSASRGRRREILDSLTHLPVHVLAMPGLVELASGTKRIDDLREVDIEDVLGRDPVRPNPALLDACIRDKVVMVTGAGGSIGSELCRQIVQLQPLRLILFDHSEYSLYAIERELRGLIDSMAWYLELVPVLGSVGHRHRIQAVMESFGVQTIYHAAAYKHVPMVEHNPIEGVQNNVFGTLYAAEAALAAGVEHFVLISTDKAVRPTNVMGATKRFAELILQALAQKGSSTRFCMVRFGNVLASSGSVVPLFRDQIRRSGPVTVTHPEVVRYFMTIPEAAQLVIQAGSMGRGGDVFLLNMGEPVRIQDLARRMIRLSGLEVKDENNPHGDIEIVYTGLRPGEKLYEELLIGEANEPTDHPMILRAQEEDLPWPVVQRYLERLMRASKEFDYFEVRSVLLEAVKGYQPECGIEDWVWVERSKTSNQAVAGLLH